MSELSQAEREQRRRAPWRHGLRSEFAETGDGATLTDPQRSRLAELRAELATPGGTHDILRDRAARIVLLCEWGESYLRDIAEQKGGAAAFEARMLQRYVSVLESARRHLELLSRLQSKGGGDSVDYEKLIEAQKRHGDDSSD